MRRTSLWVPILVMALATCAGAAETSFAELRGWTRSPKVQHFAASNLFEYIDGAADGFLAYGFQQLSVAEYTRAAKGSVVIECYRHASPLHAFGVYSQEKPDAGPFEAIGTQGYVAPPLLVFIKGTTYVKINAYDLGTETEATLRAFASAQAAALEGPMDLPGPLKLFPALGRQPNSERFVLDSVMGYAFLHQGFTAEYQVAGTKFQMMLILGRDRADAQAMLAGLLDQAKQPPRELKEGRYTFRDPNYGELSLSWKGLHLALVLNLPDAAQRQAALDRMESLLP